MKKITSIILVALLALALASCGQKEHVNTADAPEEILNAVSNAYELSKELTELQLKAGADMKLDEQEINEIGEAFRYLAIVNNKNAEDFASDKYFIALRTEYKEAYEKLADTVVFLKDCEGYDQLGMAINRISLEVRDVTELPIVEPEPVDTLNPADTMPEAPAGE
jgi:PBP1b-binding outer membrane lipoprotein LpoB